MGNFLVPVIKLRRDTTANWSSANPVLAAGEIAVEETVGGDLLFKLGDGVTLWNSLAYSGTPGPTGDTGPTGATGLPGGGIAIEYVFDTTTADADPGNGKLRLDNATQNTATAIRTDLLDNNGATWT